ncbi:hypothetical protein BDB00DRAFT_638352 [Zychaea mexicana]|uniref:uncharacterized protein n=1 Tax=Zychaea mexicana TaxID=64656 RepID=UPI0022FEBB17|nr:uncharacterized protein BDB00DRAFT_638352 [Zychaea mexicana]KAI9489079.1 hypothetical protein BDB00DRAFT_638352 [Zychaea mexicana]
MSTSQRQSSQSAADDYSFRRPQRKKRQASLNHLINFSFPDRPDDFETHHAALHDDSFSTTTATYKPFKKEHFVNANFRFLLDPSGDYSRHLDDPDACFDWDLIEQVLVYSDQVPTCPICLDPPTAARIARCGHIFCLPCILHHFHESGRTCPMCWEAASVHELRSIQTLPSSKYNIGDEIDLCLMHRKAHSMHAEPISSNTPSATNGVSAVPHDTTSKLPYARFMLASPNTLESAHERDTAALMANIEACHQEDEDGSELASLLAGLDLLNDLHDNRIQEQQQQHRPSRTNKNSNHRLVEQSQQQQQCYYFYQAMDGQWIFPGSHTIRILLEAFGDYSNFPHRLTSVPITHYEEELLTEERRKRYKFLGHVPLGCNVAWIEINLKGVVPDELLVVPSSPAPTAIVEEEEEEETMTNSERQEGPSHYRLDGEPRETRELDPMGLPIKEEWSDEEEMLEYVLKLSAVQK